MTDYVIVMSTAGSVDEAQKIAQALVSGKLAACVQIFPITSCYFWDGKVNNDTEQMMLIKTRSALFNEVERMIKSLHSYDTPEIISVSISGGSHEYTSWISSVTNEV